VQGRERHQSAAAAAPRTTATCRRCRSCDSKVPALPVKAGGRLPQAPDLRWFTE